MANHRTRVTESLEVWQWNCRTLRKKVAALARFIDTTPVSPDVICIQEPGKRIPNLVGYKLHTHPDHTQIAALTRADIAVSVDYILNCGVQHQMLTIWPCRRGKPKTVIANVYSPPRDRHAKFDMLVTAALSKVKRNDRALILGDFNAPHTDWGYDRDTPKGQRLADLAEDQGLVLLTRPDEPTRTGNSVVKDTSPDLTFSNNGRGVTWTNLGEDLGSDHCIISVSMNTARVRHRLGAATITDWIAYREKQKQTAPCQSAADWTASIRAIYKSTTRKIATTIETPAVDGHLLHLWEARRSLTKRWKRQRHNRKLKIRIAQLAQEASEYARQLQETNWLQFCDDLKGTLSTKRTWAILRSMIDPAGTRTTTSRTLKLIEHEYDGTAGALIEDIKSIYVGLEDMRSREYSYNGPDNVELDAPITTAELYAAAQSFRKNTAPGPDHVTNAMLRNLSRESLKQLTTYFNDNVWSENGAVPDDWKEATIILIPKPAKPRDLHNLRPISLTSCVGKLFEKVIQTRLSNYIERHGLFPHCMLGFRPHVSAQDAFLMLRDEVLDPPRNKEARIVVALDVKKAFDTISHHTILEGLEDIGCGRQVFRYVLSFLRDRKATIGLGSTRSDIFAMPNRGTPQGSILSPLLFNVGMRRLALELEQVRDLGCAIYADDITLWAHRGSYGEKQDLLQEAIDKVATFTKHAGMTCAPEKSEFITVRSKRCKKAGIQIDLDLEGHAIREVTQMRVLGLLIQENGNVDATIRSLKLTVKNVARMIRRVGRSRNGLAEEETIRLVQAFVINRITYGLPFQKLNQTEVKQVDTLIRMAYKSALGLPNTVSTESLERLGIYNKYEEHATAVLISQRERLSSTPQGRSILQRLGYDPRPPFCGDKTDLLPRDLRDRLYVAPIPRNMSAKYHAGRRQARTRALQKRFGNDPTAYFTDASATSRKDFYTIAASNKVTTITAMVKTTSVCTAEAAAVALAIRDADFKGQPAYVLTDSQAACRLFMRGTLPHSVARILGSCLDIDHSIMWCPAHNGLEGNERADRIARGSNDRAAGSALKEPPPIVRDILEIQRRERRTFGPPHPKLNRTQARDWRRIQTNSYPHLNLLCKMHPACYKNTCPWCSEKPTLAHITWECVARPKSINSTLLRVADFTRQWEALLASEDRDNQLALLDQAQRAARASGALD